MVWMYFSVFMILISDRNSGIIAPVRQPCFRVKSYLPESMKKNASISLKKNYLKELNNLTILYSQSVLI